MRQKRRETTSSGVEIRAAIGERGAVWQQGKRRMGLN
jgi:hypothetical protein